MNLAVGVIGRSAPWEDLLTQEGVPFGYVSLDALDREWSVLVVTSPMNETQKSLVESYLYRGGAVLGYAAYCSGVRRMTCRSEPIEYLLADGSEPFPDTHLLDLGVEGEIPREANCLRTQHREFAAFAGPLGNGFAVLLPFDPAAAIADDRAANKNFYATRDRLPSERVSLVGKGEVQRLVHRALAFLHHARNLPYAHLWYFPDTHRTLFAFRIDSDKGSREEVDALYHLAVRYDVPMTWFLDVKAHEEWLQHFAYLAGQEFGVHCYEHRVFETYEENLKNILRARQKLDRVGVASHGFAGPFGMWNPALARAIDQVGFEYSSEFSYAYDALPLHTYGGQGDAFSTLQVPIHPICSGSLRQVGYSETQMADYFHRVMDEKRLRNESWFFYHHPTHRAWDVVEAIFVYVRDHTIECTTLASYARWWKKRIHLRPTISIERDLLRCEGVPSDCSVALRIILPDRRHAIVPYSQPLALSGLSWEAPPPYAPPPSDVHRIREFDPRKLVGDLFTTLTRKFSERK